MQVIPQYNTKLFTEIFEDAASFLTDYQAFCTLTSLTAAEKITDAHCTLLYYLLYARYGNSPIANFDETQFKYKMWSIITSHGTTWEKRMSIQASLRSLTDTQIKQGATFIYNHAYNPNTTPSTQELDEISFINEQNVTKNKRGEIEGYAALWQVLRTDVTTNFLNQFEGLFKRFVMPAVSNIYITED